MGVWIIILKGMTPIPYKLGTIASRVAHFDLLSFVGASIVFAAIRFFLLAALLWWFGDLACNFIERRLTTVFVVRLVSGLVMLCCL